MAVLQHKAAVCTMCGTSESEWKDPSGELDPAAFAAVRHTCPGCAVKDRARLAAQNDKVPEPPGTTWTLIPRRLAEVAKATGRRRPMSPRERARR